MTVASKAQVLYVHWERHGKDCDVEIFGAGVSAAFLGGASIDSALRLLRTLPLLEAFGTVVHKTGPSDAAKEDILRNAETAMRVDASQGEIVFCSRSTREEVAAALALKGTSMRRATGGVVASLTSWLLPRHIACWVRSDGTLDTPSGRVASTPCTASTSPTRGRRKSNDDDSQEDGRS